MREQFVSDVITRLNGKVADEDLRTINNILLSCVNEYDLTRRCTEIEPRTSYIPLFYPNYLVAKKLSGRKESTLAHYNLRLMQFFSWMRRPIEEIGESDIIRFLYDIQKVHNMGNRTLDGVRIVLNGFFSWALNKGFIRKNPCATIDPISYTPKKIQPLTAMQMVMIRDACSSIRDRAMIEVLYSSGCRVGELITLKWSDIDFDTYEIALFGKGEKHRKSYLSDAAVYWLQKYKASTKVVSMHVFTSMRSPYRQLSKGGVQARISKIGDAAGVENLHPHRFRHSFATHALERGMRVHELQTLLGHEKMDTTMIYAKISNENVRHNHRRFIV